MLKKEVASLSHMGTTVSEPLQLIHKLSTMVTWLAVNTALLNPDINGRDMEDESGRERRWAPPLLSWPSVTYHLNWYFPNYGLGILQKSAIPTDEYGRVNDEGEGGRGEERDVAGSQQARDTLMDGREVHRETEGV